MRRILVLVLATVVLTAACGGAGSEDAAVGAAAEWVTLEDGPVVVTQTISSQIGDAELFAGTFILTFADRDNFRSESEDDVLLVREGEVQPSLDGSSSDLPIEIFRSTTIASLEGMTEFRTRDGIELIGDGPRIDGEETALLRLVVLEYGDEKAVTLRESSVAFGEDNGLTGEDLPAATSGLEEIAAAVEGAIARWEFTVGRRTGRVYFVRFETEGPNVHQTVTTEFSAYGESVVLEPGL